LVKTKQGKIIGGFTSKSWGPRSDLYTIDEAAFIFNMNQRFNQTSGTKSISHENDGFCFGNRMLYLTGSKLNANNAGDSDYADTNNGYDIP
jgi:hypothetical protein